MILTRHDIAERVIEAASALLTAALAAALLVSGSELLRSAALPPSPPVTIALTLSPPPAPAPAPAPSAPAPPLVSQTVAPPQTEEAPPAPAPVVHARSPLPAPRPPRHRSARPAAAFTPTPAAAAPSEPQAAISPAASAPSRAEDASADALYISRVHATIERNKRTPDSPAYRMMHPHGTAVVVFVLDRNGRVSDVRLAGSSGSPLLDTQAEDIVAYCRFPPMPDAAFHGASRTPFQYEITFPPFGSAD
jgi:TonB family protein